MKTTLIPAEVTTFEDKLLAGLTLVQLGFILSPLLIIGFQIMALPPFVTYEPYKLVVGLAVGAPLVSQAIRIDGQVLYKTFGIWINYVRRPKIYVSLRTVGQIDSSIEDDQKNNEGEVEDMLITLPSITSSRAKLTVEMERDF